MAKFKEYVQNPEQRAPLVIESSTLSSLTDLVQSDRSALLERLLEHGALLFRGFAVQGTEDFDAFVASLSSRRMDYVYGSTPRRSLGKRIFSATEYPPQLEIPLHNENAYQRIWPLKLALCCLVPAANGGETPIADMRRVNTAIGAELMDKFEDKGVRYVRYYRPFIDVSWQAVFQTEDRRMVARFCAENDIEHRWLDDETLFTSQTCQGVARHPQTGQRVFFNQAHLFHLSSLGAESAQAFQELYGERVPRQTCFGDGGEIPLEDLTTIRHAFNRSKMVFPWMAGDVLLIDNMQVAHGRQPFKGERKVIVALMESHSEPKLQVK